MRLPLTDIENAAAFGGSGDEALAVNEGSTPSSSATVLSRPGSRCRAHAANTTYTGTVSQLVERRGRTLVLLAIEHGAQLALDPATVRFEEIT